MDHSSRLNRFKPTCIKLLGMRALKLKDLIRLAGVHKQAAVV